MDPEAPLRRPVVTAQLGCRRGLCHSDARQAPRRPRDRRELPASSDRVPRLAPDITREQRKRCIAERTPVGHHPQHPLVVKREISDVARHLATPVPAPQRLT